MNAIRNIKGNTISAYLPITFPVNQGNKLTGNLVVSLPELWLAINNKENKIEENAIIKK